MSITSTFHNATSGLAATARAVQVVSANIANAMTPGHAPRSLDLVASSLGGAGGGVRVLGVSRSVDPGLLGLSRDSGASASGTRTTLRFWEAAESALGLPGEGVSAALAEFDAALLSAAARPDLDSRLAQVVERAQTLVAAIARAGESVQNGRAAADAAIARDVEALNSGLKRVAALNDQIVRLRAGGQSTVGLEDERQAMVSSLAEIVPLREQARADGRITLYSAGGELLLDLEAASFGFSQAPAVDASMGPGAGLSTLTLRGRAVDTGPGGPLAGGRLAASFQTRDTDAPQVQSALDSLATALVTRFADSATDPTLPAGAPGLFTDSGALPGSAPGLSGRLAVNTAVQPDAGGALWRLRDGIGAALPGPVGDASGLARLSGALDRRIAAAPGQPLRSLAEDLGALLAQTSTRRQGASEASASAAARSAEIEEQVLARGVDTDAELQRLMLIEQAYAANARVISTADSLLRQLLEI